MEGLSVFGIGFACGLVAGFVASLVALRYFEKQYPEQRAAIDGRAPFVKRKAERKKPVVTDDYKEWQKEIERMKEQGR
jgi:hypothetical protein